MESAQRQPAAAPYVRQPAYAPLATLQGAFERSPRMVAQRRALQAAFGSAFHSDQTGLPNQLRAGIESLSGVNMSDVRVHRNSDKPAQLNALAYAQGNDIHLAPGQDAHLPHEAWHVVQQAQGRVKPTLQMKQGVSVNDDASLEREADVMGARASFLGETFNASGEDQHSAHVVQQARGHANSTYYVAPLTEPPLQRKVGFEFEMAAIATRRRNIIGNGVHPHSKGYVLRTLPGYQLTADVDPTTGGSQLELIFNAIDEGNAPAVANLINTTAPAAVAAVTAIVNAAANWTRADQIGGVGGSHFDEYRDYSGGVANIFGQLQMTAGIDPAKLLLHMTGNQATNYLATLTPMGTGNADDDAVRGTLAPYEAFAAGIGLVAGPHALVAVNATAALGGVGIPAAARNHLAGIVALMATIPFTARTAGAALPYAKSAAGAHLARTDFARMMKGLPNALKATLTTADMQQIVLTTINAAIGGGAVVAADAVFPPGSVGGGAPPLNALSIGNWVAGVMPTQSFFGGYKKGTDSLTKKHFPGSKAAKSQMESLGGYGDKLDPGDFPILEFRTMPQLAFPDLTEQLRRLLNFVNH